MADISREIVLKLTINGQEALATLKVTAQENQELITKIRLLESEYANAFQKIATELSQHNEITEEAINQTTKWLSAQDLTAVEIEKVISELQQQNATVELNSTKWLENEKNIQLLRNSYTSLISNNKQLVQAKAKTVAGVNQMNMAMGQLGWALGDANMFVVNFRMGMMSVANNIPMVINALTDARKAAADTGTTFKAQLASSLAGSGGLMLAINGLMFLLQLLPALFSNTTKEVEKQKKEVDDLKKSYESLTKAQIVNRLKEYEAQLSQLESKHSAYKTYSAGGSYGMGGYKIAVKIDDEKERFGDDLEQYNNMKKQVQALKEMNAEIGVYRDISNNISLNEEKLMNLRKDPESKNYYKNLVPDAKNFEDAVNKLNQWIESDRKQLNSAKERQKLVNQAYEKQKKQLEEAQQHEEKMAEINGQGDLRIRQLKISHYKEMLELQKKHGKDTKDIEYKLQEEQAEYTKLYGAKNLKTYQQLHPQKKLNELAPKELGNNYMSGDDLDKIKANSIDDEYERQRALADLEYSTQLNKYEDFANFEEIKTALYAEHSRKKQDIDRAEAEHKLSMTSNMFSALKGYFGEHTAAYKVLTIFQTTIDTYQAAVAAYKSTAEIPLVGPFLAPAAAAAATIFGMSKVNTIEKTKVPGYAKGSMGLVGEEGPEIIAPLEEYASGQSRLITATVMAVERNIQTGKVTGTSKTIESMMQNHLDRLNNWSKEISFKIKGDDLVTSYDKNKKYKNSLVY